MSIDPRAESLGKLVPPHPLPYVSRKALKRVKSPLPPPTHCPNCGGQVALVSNEEIYRREYGARPFAYLCRDSQCGSYVGLHPDTDIPLGTLANALLREARKAAKAAFQVQMRHRGLDRKDMYSWLATRVSISVNDCHFAWFDLEQGALAEKVCLEPGQ